MVVVSYKVYFECLFFRILPIEIVPRESMIFRSEFFGFIQ